MINERRDETIRRLLNITVRLGGSSSNMVNNEIEAGNKFNAHADADASGKQSSQQSANSDLQTSIPTITTTITSAIDTGNPESIDNDGGEDVDAEDSQLDVEPTSDGASRESRSLSSSWSWWQSDRGQPVEQQEQLTASGVNKHQKIVRKQQRWRPPRPAPPLPPATTRVKMEPMIEFLEDRQNSLEADEKVCQLIESGVRVIVGPSDGTSIQHVQSICDNMELPYFELRPFIGSPTISAGGVARSSASEVANVEGQTGSMLTGAADDNNTTRPLYNIETKQSQVAPNKLEDLTLNLYPPAHLLNSAYIDLIYAWNWTSFVIVYQDGSSMIKLQDLFKESSGSWTSRWQIRLFQFDPDSAVNSSKQQSSNMRANSGENRYYHNNSTGDTTTKETIASYGQPSGEQQNLGAKSREKLGSFRDIFWRIRLSGEQNILLDVKTEHLYEALKQAQQVGCMTERFNYLVTSLDLHTIDLEDFKYSRTRITALSILQLARTNSTSQASLSSLPSSFDEAYLEKLGIHTVAKPAMEQTQAPSWTGEPSMAQAAGKVKHKLSPSVVLDKLGAFMEPPADAYKDWTRRELLMS